MNKWKGAPSLLPGGVRLVVLQSTVHKGKINISLSVTFLYRLIPADF